MKDMKYYLRFVVLMLCFSFVACDDDEKAAEPIFPELQKIECAVGEEQTLTFDAAGDWTLVSSALWCKFVVDGKEAFTCSGTAGKQSVTIKITDDATELLKSYKAELSLMTGGTKQVIFTVTRPVTEEELHVFNGDVECTAEIPFVKSYGNSENLTVSANTDWIVESSEGLELGSTISGLAGDKVVLDLTLKNGFTKNAWQGSLTFKNRDNETIANVSVNYDGIPADKIELGGLNPFVPIVFSYDGWTYTLNNEKHDTPMPIKVVAKDDQYTYVLVNYTSVRNDVTWEYEYDCTIPTGGDIWFDIDKDDHAGYLELGLWTNNGMERTGYLLVFPKVVYDEIKDDFEAKVFSKEEGIVEKYVDYIAVNIKQAGHPKFTTGFVITDGEGNPLLNEWQEPIEAMPYASTGGVLTSEQLEAMYGTTNVSVLSLPLSIDYSTIVGKPNGFTGYYVQATAEFNGVNTAWSSVKVDTWSMLEFSIMGLDPVANGENEMTISCLDNENVHAVLLVQPRY